MIYPAKCTRAEGRNGVRGGYIGAQQEEQGRAVGTEAIKRAGLKAGDKAIVFGSFENENRARASAARWRS